MALIGADGVGKTLLARQRRADVAADDRCTGWSGTATQRVIPFGAFCALLADADITETARPAELLRAAQDYLTGDGARQLFVVDDAH